eukprot:scaffold62720_cov59-Phaeocystis_antarctica.AAC.5
MIACSKKLRVPLGAAAPLERLAPLLCHAERLAAAMVHERSDGCTATAAAPPPLGIIEGSPAGESWRGRLESGRGVRRCRGQPGPWQLPRQRRIRREMWRVQRLLPARRHGLLPARRGARGILAPLGAGAACVESGHGRGRARRNVAARTPTRRHGAAWSSHGPPCLPMSEVRLRHGLAGRARASLARRGSAPPPCAAPRIPGRTPGRTSACISARISARISCSARISRCISACISARISSLIYGGRGDSDCPGLSCLSCLRGGVSERAISALISRRISRISRCCSAIMASSSCARRVAACATSSACCAVSLAASARRAISRSRASTSAWFGDTISTVAAARFGDAVLGENGAAGAAALGEKGDRALGENQGFGGAAGSPFSRS